ncbi:MAG: LacI family DNA-binding transcriptional regulator [Lysinibacillus sp.]
MVNIKDVAKEANLSVATVSRYLNQNGYVSKQSTEKIERAIAALKYKPNSIARSLSKKQSNFIGLIVPDITNPYFPQLARAVEDTALAYNYTVVLCNSDEQADKEQLYVERLSQKYVAGLIVSTSLLDNSLYENIDIPIVALDRKMSESIPSVTTDNVKGAKIGTQYLLEKGAKQLLCLRGPQGLQTADDRLLGFQQAINEHVDVAAVVVETAFDFQMAAQEVERALIDNPYIDGIFASSDTSAIAALKVAHKLRKRVPEDVQIVGFDGIALGEMISPELTTVGQDLYAIGKQAAEMLITQIENKQLQQIHTIIDAQLLVRGTTKGE